MHAARSVARARPFLSRLAVCCGGLFFCLLLICQPARLSAQSKPDGGAATAARSRALQLYSEGKHLEALPLLEQAAEANPADGAVLQHLAFALITQSHTLSDPAARKAARFRARAIFLRQVELGYNVEVAQSLVDKMPPDGGNDDTFSTRDEVNKVMQEGESFFASRQLDKAIAAYEHALELEPKLYEAALYIADVYFLQQNWAKASEWYARTIAIDPERETAHRYWSDALLKQGKMAEARAKAVEAIIGEPYNRSAWVGLIQWGQANGVELAHPQIDMPLNMTPAKDKKMTLNIDPKALSPDDGSLAWLMYVRARAPWAADKLAKEFPAEKLYRHTLREEVDAFGQVVEHVKRGLKENNIKALNPSLAHLVKLHDEGMLEAYILFARADEGIAQDYAEYRKNNRDKLRRYLMEFVTVKK